MAHIVKAARKHQASLPCSPLKDEGFWTDLAFDKLLANCIVETLARVAIATARSAIGSAEGCAGGGCGSTLQCTGALLLEVLLSP